MAFPLSDEEHAAIKARIEAQEELIVAAAVRISRGGLPIILFCERPGRHGDVIWDAGLLSGDRMSGGEHGFVTSRGRFVDRQEAAELVAATGQGSHRDMGPTYPAQLFSEDMWNDWDRKPQTPIDPSSIFGEGPSTDLAVGERTRAKAHSEP